MAVLGLGLGQSALLSVDSGLLTTSEHFEDLLLWKDWVVVDRRDVLVATD